MLESVRCKPFRFAANDYNEKLSVELHLFSKSSCTQFENVIEMSPAEFCCYDL